MGLPKAHAVTGAFGFTGSYIAQKLLVEGQRVVTFTGSPQRDGLLQGKIEVRPYLFESVEKMAASLQDVEVLYNTYWVRFNHADFNYELAEHNTRNMFKAAKMAGVSRIVHISVANANSESCYGYYRGKGKVELALKDSGLSYAILRPAVFFGPGGILINNIAWTLRYLPVFAVFGDGNYCLQPIFVEDFATLAVEQGKQKSDTIIEAIGPETFTYRELIHCIGKGIGKNRPLLRMPILLGKISSALIGLLMRDKFVTADELAALMNGLLYTPGAKPAGKTHLADWVATCKDSLGLHYANELARRRNKTIKYF